MTYALCYYSIPTAVSIFNRNFTKQNVEDIASFVCTYIRDDDAKLIKVDRFDGKFEVDEFVSEVSPHTLLVVGIEVESRIVKSWKQEKDLITAKAYAELKSRRRNLSYYSENDDGTVLAFTKLKSSEIE